MKKETALELKVGLFLSAGIGLILFAILMLGGATSVFARKNTYVMHFPAGEGLISGSKVLLGGLSVGVVSDVNFEPAARNVRVEISVERRFADMIRADSTGEIATQGLLGDRYIAVTLGSEGADPLPDRAEIPVRASKDLAQILSQSDKLMVNLNRIATNLDQILASFNTGNRSELFFSGMASTAKNLSQVSSKLNSQLEEMKLGDSGRRLNSILTKIDRGEGTVGALINDPAMYDDLKSLTGGANRNRVLRNIVRKSIKDAEAAEAPAAK
jgi:phospholipid/cholesterol/gamma-HCH transport system substrate-binding protein